MVSHAGLFPQDADDLGTLATLGGLAHEALLDDLRGRIDAHRQQASRLEAYGEPTVAGVFEGAAEALEEALK